MYKKTLWVTVFFVSFASALIAHNINPPSSQTLERVGELLGSFLGVLFLPAIYLLIAQPSLRKSENQKVSKRVVVTTLTILTVVTVSVIYMSYKNRKNVQELSIWAPITCEFKVTFPSSYELYDLDLGLKGYEKMGRLDLFGAETSYQGSLYRAECVNLSRDVIEDFNEETLYHHMQLIADNFGLDFTTFKHSKAGDYLVGTIIGTKYNGDSKVILEISNFIGEHSVMTIYLATEPKKYRTKEMINFFNSVEKSII